MKEGLKQKLIQYLKDQGGKHIPHWQLMMLVKQWGYRESNAERRLREAEEIGKDYEKGVIKGYYWKTASLNALQQPKPLSDLTPTAKAFLEKWKPKVNQTVSNALF